MNLVDANVLIYAVDADAKQHLAAKSWLDTAFAEDTPIILPWVSLLAFIRLTTSPRIFKHPLEIEQAFEVIDIWQSASNVVRYAPDARHGERMMALLESVGSYGGNLVNDAHLAALAMQYQAVVVTFDQDFNRFKTVSCHTPT